MPARPLARLAIASALAALGGCGARGATPERLAEAARAARSENGLCPIMDRLVDPAHVVEVGGARIGLCCPACEQTFRQDPERWLRALRADPGRYGYRPAAAAGPGR
jgi:hypothetical protein